MRLETHVQALTDCMKDRSQVVHAGVASRREHAMQAFARLGCQQRKLLETDGRIDQVAQDQPCRLGLPVEEQRGCFVQQRSSERRIALDPFDYRLLEIACQCHGLQLFPLPPPSSKIIASPSFARYSR